MTAKCPENKHFGKNIAARWMQAVAMTLALYLMMAMGQSQSIRSTSLQGRSSVTQTDLRIWLVAAIPMLPTLL